MGEIIPLHLELRNPALGDRLMVGLRAAWFGNLWRLLQAFRGNRAEPRGVLHAHAEMVPQRAVQDMSPLFTETKKQNASLRAALRLALRG